MSVGKLTHFLIVFTYFRIYKYLKLRQNTCLCCHCVSQAFTWITSVCQQQEIDSLEISRWQVSYAPYPDDINWKDLTVDYKWIWLRKAGIYLFLFIIFFFLSTPSILMKTTEFITNQKAFNETIQNLEIVSKHID